LTHRGLASSFAVVTAQEDDEKAAPSVDWARLATAVDTLVIMMGSASLGSVAQALIAGGRAPDTPAISVEWGTTPEQRSVGAPLVWIDAAVREAGLGAPLLTVVGKVASLREHLSWFESQPLFGKRVLVTRTRQQTSALADLLRRAGASPVELPAIELVPLAGESEIEFVVEELEARLYTWCLFTSPNAVDYIFAHLDRTQRDARVFTGCRVAALGSATESALAKRGLRAELTAAEFTSGGLLEALPSELRGARVLVPRAEGGSPGLVDGLRARGAQVDELLLYETRAPLEVPSEIVQLIRDGKIDVATFASSSSVRNLGGLLGSDFLRLRESVVACIGPVTAATARDLGLTVHIEPQTHTIPALVEALVEHLGGAKR
jgi:uroporphyrinogen III methyltransferase/synthase